jgi:predicted phage baseplate assembly protein
MIAVPPPLLDRRDDEQILEQLRKLAAEYVPEWQAYQDGRPDAGIMLHRIFTRLLEITLQRLNEAPSKNFDAFLNAVGVSLLPPVPARVPLTFSLTPRSGPILVPQGTRAGTPSQGDQPGVDFETEADLTVVPNTLVSARTVDPGWDRWADHSSLIDGSNESGFAPLLGAKRLPHALFIGDEPLLDFNRAEVTVSFSFTNSEAANQLAKMVWQYLSEGELITPSTNATENKITFDVSKRIAPTILKGPSESSSLRQGVRNRWLQAALPRPLSENHAPKTLILKGVRVSISAKNIPLDFAFANAVPLDVTTAFSPFGDEPKVGDAFYLACSEAFAKPNANVTLSFECSATPRETILQWEFLGAAGWTQFESVLDQTAALSKSGNVVLKSAGVIWERVNGEDGLWIRVRIQSGDYGRAAEYIEVDPNDSSKGFKLKEDTGNLAPPLVTRLTLSYQADGVPESLVTRNGFLLTDQTVASQSGFNPFVEVHRLTPSIYAERASCLYLGFDRVFPEEPMTLYFVVAPRGANAELAAARTRSPSGQPSLRWEYFNGVAWTELSVLDRTMQFSQSGTVDVLIPADIEPLAKFDLEEIYWIRAMLVPPSKNGDPFRSDPLLTPRLHAIFINTVPAIQALTISNEILGSGNGLPGQRFRLTQNPVLARPEIFMLEPELPSAVERSELEWEQGSEAIQQRVNPATEQVEIWIRWREMPDFNGSSPHSRHYTLDHGTGELAFGNGILGLVPPFGVNNIVANYRVSAGSAGNVATGTVVQFRSPVPGVASVTNRLDAEGGAGLETAEIARQRGPQSLRHRGRALSRTDFEWLAREAAGTRIARVVCLPNINRAFQREPGWVTLVIVPQGTERKLVPTVDLIQQVENSFHDRSFAGLGAFNRVHVTGPDYIEVAVAVDVVLRDLRQAAQVKREIAKALDRFLHPLTGGPAADGWKLGRDVFASEIASVVHTVPGVDYLNSLQLIPSQAQHRIGFTFSWVCPFDLPENTLIVSRDGRKSALLGESITAGSELRSLTTKGFKVGDRIVQELDADVFNPPLTITAVTADRESATQIIGIQSWEYDRPAPGILLATPDHRIKLPVSPVGLESPVPALQFLTVEDFSESEVVQIQLTKQGAASPTLQIQQVSPASDICVGGVSLVCPGQHRITVSSSTMS